MATATSETVTVVAPALQGIWLHTAEAPDVEQHYLYQSGERTETLGAGVTHLQFVGRRFGVAEYGDDEQHSVSLPLHVPWGPYAAAAVQWLRDAFRARRVLCYRDNRGRLVYGVLGGEVSINDVADGTTIDGTLQRVDYDENAA